MALCLLAAALSFAGDYNGKAGLVGFWLFRELPLAVRSVDDR
jgi:hypothetical protein